MNGDGVLDIVHSGSTPFNETEPHSLTVYLNAHGVLRAQGPSLFAWVQPWQLSGFGEGFRPFFTRGMGRAYPIDLDGRAGIDFVSNVQTPLTAWLQVEPNEYTFYSILSTSPLTSAERSVPNLPTSFRLHAPYPNPFNPSTTIRFTVEKSGWVTLRAFDLLGREVRKLFDGEVEVGRVHQTVFDARELTSGMYFIRLESGGKAATQKVMLVR